MLDRGGSSGYVGLICKNPLHERWDTHIHRAEPYDLGELSEWVELPQWIPKRDSHKESEGGRNVALFERLRKWAYRNVRHSATWEDWRRACRLQAVAYNDAGEPLPSNEANNTADSVARYTWHSFDLAASDKRFSERQAARGRASGKARAAASEDKRSSARLMRSKGMTQAAIAAELGVHVNTVAGWLKG